MPIRASEGFRDEGSRGEGSRGEGSRGEGSRGEGSRGEGSRINLPQMYPIFVGFVKHFSRRVEKEGSRSFCDPLLLRAIMRAQGVSFVYGRVSEGRVSVEKGAARRKR